MAQPLAEWLIADDEFFQRFQIREVSQFPDGSIKNTDITDLHRLADRLTEQPAKQAAQAEFDKANLDLSTDTDTTTPALENFKQKPETSRHILQHKVTPVSFARAVVVNSCSPIKLPS